MTAPGPTAWLSVFRTAGPQVSMSPLMKSQRSQRGLHTRPILHLGRAESASLLRDLRPRGNPLREWLGPAGAHGPVQRTARTARSTLASAGQPSSGAVKASQLSQGQAQGKAPGCLRAIDKVMTALPFPGPGSAGAVVTVNNSAQAKVKDRALPLFAGQTLINSKNSVYIHHLGS